MNWQVRNPLHCTADGCTAKAEIEALREKVAEWERGDRQYPQAVQDYKDLCVELKRTQVDLAAITEECNLGHTLYSKSLDDLAAMTKERDDYRAALEICKTEMQGDKWDALYIDTVLAKYSEDAIEQASRLV